MVSPHGGVEHINFILRLFSKVRNLNVCDMQLLFGLCRVMHNSYDSLVDSLN